MRKSVRLRAHHGMCLAFFRGQGYSSGFTANMEKVHSSLKEDTQIELCVGKDVICSACPNLQKGVCTTAEKVEKYDKRVLEACGFSAGSRITWKEFSQTVEKNIIESGKRKEICGDCSWTELCVRKETVD